MATNNTERTAPTITLLRVDGHRMTAKVRVEGGDLAPAWRGHVREGETPWCEMTVYLRGGFVTMYGGTVWPGAWPHLFRIDPPTKDGQRVYLTPAGYSLVEKLANDARL